MKRNECFKELTKNYKEFFDKLMAAKERRKDDNNLNLY